MGRPVVHFQIVTKSPDKLQGFYSKLFDWEVSANNALGYRTIDTGSEKGINGGIWPAPPEAPSFVQLFVDVDDVDACIQKALPLGGSVIIPPQKLPDGDEMAVIRDPEGIPIALMKPATV